MPTSQDTECKVILGIDLGTTYTGVAFVTTNKTSDDIVVITKWPSHRDNSWKAPSVIAYASENLKIKIDNWGFEVTGNLKRYAWTKLLLDSSVDVAHHDDPLLSKMYGSEGFLRLPPHKTAQDVISDFLSQVYRHTIRMIERELSTEVFKTLPMECWITVPAIWSDGARHATREAAIQAGFGTRQHDSVNMVTEPEAAALWALKPHLSPSAVDPLQSGECILVCDCGGGTVDLVTYEILQVEPLKFSEKCVGTGAKCGATAIDRNFVDWMELNFAEAYTELGLRKRGPGSTFMESFEVAKRRFDDRDDAQNYFEIGDIDLKLVLPSNLYDEDDQCVKVSRHVMRSFFDIPIRNLIAKLDDQVLQLKKKNGKLDRLVLVGGFGDSPYLNDRLNTWRNENNVKRFTSPANCQAAIVLGAVLRGLDNIRPDSVIAKRHYGWEIGFPFRQGVDEEKDAFYSIWDGKKRCVRLYWVVQKGQELDTNFYVTRDIVSHHFEKSHEAATHLRLYSCALDEMPERPDDHGVRQECSITTTFTAQADASRFKFNKKFARQVYEYEMKMKVHFRAKSGVLEFKTFKRSRTEEASKTTISFDK